MAASAEEHLMYLLDFAKEKSLDSQSSIFSEALDYYLETAIKYGKTFDSLKPDLLQIGDERLAAGSIKQENYDSFVSVVNGSQTLVQYLRASANFRRKHRVIKKINKKKGD